MSEGTNLMVVDNSKIVVPKQFHPRLIQLYHTSHSGVQKITTSLQERFHWSNLKTEVRTHVDQCKDCQTNVPTRSIQPFCEDVTSLATLLPMEQLPVTGQL